MEKIESYDYPRQFILKETEGTKIYKKINVDESSVEVDDYQWQVVSTINDAIVEDEIYTLIQHEDSQLGWIKFDDSIQIFRFNQKIARFIDDEFEVNTINEKLNITKDFRTHFSGKLLSIKSEITYDDKRLVGVFIKDKFFGFHDEKYFEELADCNIKIPQAIISEKELFKTSKMHESATEEIEFLEPVLISIFKKSNIGKIKVNSKEYYWIHLDGLEEYTEKIKLSSSNKSKEQKQIDDLFYSVKKERQHSKEIVKTVLSFKEYLKSKRKNGSLDYDIASNNEVRSELKTMKKQIENLNKKLKLNETRLEQQRDYNRRLEDQKNKYKDRMNLLEEKFRKLNKEFQ